MSNQTMRVSELRPAMLRLRIGHGGPWQPPEHLLPPLLREDRPLELLDDPGAGVLARGSQILFFFEPPTGVFRFTTLAEDPLLSGRLEFDTDRPGSLHLEIARGGMLLGRGQNCSALFAAGPERLRLERDGTGLLPTAVLIRLPAESVVAASESTGVWVALIVIGFVPVELHLGREAADRLALSWPIKPDRSPIDLVVCAGSLADIGQAFGLLLGRPVVPPAALLGAGTRSRVTSADEWMRLAPRLKHFDFVSLGPELLDGQRAFRLQPAISSASPSPFREYSDRSRVLLGPVTPAVLVEDGNRIYQQGLDGDFFCRGSGGAVFQASGPGGKSAFPDLSSPEGQLWWQRCHADLIGGGLNGFHAAGSNFHPIPDNDPSRAEVRHRHGAHVTVRGAYPKLLAEAAAGALTGEWPGRRPAVLVDGVSAGVGPHAGVLLECPLESAALREMLAHILALAATGVPFVGFQCSLPPLHKNPRRTETLLRRMEVASLLPLFFLAEDERDLMESAPSETRVLFRKHVRRRYRLLPFLQTLLHRAATDGEPPLLPVELVFPATPSGPPLDQFVLGGCLLIAPVFEAGQEVRRVRLPAGVWYEFETGRPHQGNTELEIPLEPGYYPLFVRAGTILPLCPVRDTVRESLDAGLILEIYPGEELFGRVLLDGGDVTSGPVYEREFHGRPEHNGTIRLTCRSVSSGYEPPFAQFRFRLNGPYPYATVDGRRQEGVLENLVREERLLDVHSHDIARSAEQIEFHYSGSFQFS